ncbi:unnamed protein product [Sympodiomycopsis kandeliae]
MAFKLQVHNRSSPGANKATSSPFPLQLTFDSTPTLLEVKKSVNQKIRKLSPERQRITTEDKKPLLDDKDAVPVSSGTDLYVKDLGPQVAWRTVFLTEYAGPLFIHPLIYFASQKIYGSYKVSDVQEIALGLVLAHYVKREIETVFVHRFSSGTMPLFNIFKNSAHYWILSGALLAGAIYRPGLGQSALANSIQASPVYLTACAVVWTLAEVGNLQCHLILRNLRSPGTRERKIPRGFAFEYVSCPNYFFETIAWVAFTALTLSPAAALFSAVSVGQMSLWAIKKHKQYKKEFGKEYPRRKILIPFIW